MTPPLPTREQLPNALLEQATWVGWRRQTRGGDETKVLRDVTGGDASATDPVTWTTFDIARAYATDGPADGVSYVFTDDDPFVGVAFDACRDSETGVTDDWAEELIERVSNAANGGTFSRLWCGDTTGNDSHSEADMALCSLLAFWTAGDAQQIDRLVRDSRLSRPKWDAVQFSGGSTDGETTIERAIAGTSD